MNLVYGNYKEIYFLNFKGRKTKEIIIYLKLRYNLINNKMLLFILNDFQLSDWLIIDKIS